MGVFRRGSSTDRGEHYADVEGLIVNIGVIQALVMSFVVAMQMTVLPRTMTEANFLGLLCASKDFRKFTVHTLESYEHPDFGYFNFTRETGIGDGVLDIKQFLLGGADDEPQLKVFDDANFNIEDVMQCLSIEAMSGSYEAMLPAFPMDRMMTWLAFHKDSVLVSNEVLWYIAIGAGFNFGGLFISILLYISLTLSPSHEDATGAALKGWTRCGMWLAIVDILLLAIALTFFALGMGWFVTANSSDWAKVKGLTLDLTFSTLTAPLTGLGGFVGIVAWMGSQWAKRKQEREEAASVVGKAASEAGPAAPATREVNV